MSSDNKAAPPPPDKVARARLKMVSDCEPMSYLWARDRGKPIHRHYLETFLAEFRRDIRGHCLEFQDPEYALEFGGDQVTKLDILHIDDSNKEATIVADLTKKNSLPDNQFDCILCTHVLHMIFDLQPAISDIHRILKPGGVLLVAVPHISMCGPEYHELWRFTPEGLERLLAQSFGGENVMVKAYGNSLTAAGEIRGMIIREFTEQELAYHDPRFAVEICARAIKV